MRRKRATALEEDSGDEGMVNLTPLIDVVFVVLIMFIIVAPMLEVDRVALASAAAHVHKEMAVPQENGALNIHVHADNSIWVNKVRVNLTQLHTFLKEVKRRRPHQIPQLFHDKKAYFETYQSIKNAAEEAGFSEIDLILTPG